MKYLINISLFILSSYVFSTSATVKNTVSLCKEIYVWNGEKVQFEAEVVEMVYLENVTDVVLKIDPEIKFSRLKSLLDKFKSRDLRIKVESIKSKNNSPCM